MLCREQFLKYPPDGNAKSQLLDKVSKAIDGDASKVQHRNNIKETTFDDSNWVTDDEDSSGEELSPRRRRKKLRDIEQRIELLVMKEIFDAQTDEVKEVIIGLHKMQIKGKNTSGVKRLSKSGPFILKKEKKSFKNKKKTKLVKRPVISAAPGTLQTNRKILARLQRRRRHGGKPQTEKKHKKKFPRRKPPVGAKKGNRQGKKRYLRAQKYFNKEVVLVGRKLLDEVWQAVKDPNMTALSFCNNNIHCLSRAHRKQIALYEKIEDDLHRLDIVRQERVAAAAERKAKEAEKDTLRQELKNKIEAKEAARLEREASRKERRAARKERALEKKMRKEKAKADQIKSGAQARF